MSVEEISKKTKSFYMPRFEIEINRNKLDDVMAAAISQLTVEEKVNEGSSFSFILSYEIDNETQEHTWLDDERFNVGGSVSIKIGYETDLLTILMGTITGLESEFAPGVPPAITVRGANGQYLPASYANFLITNEAVLVPVYGAHTWHNTSISKGSL